MQDQETIINSGKTEKLETVAGNQSWEKTHPLTTNQSRILYIFFAIIILILGAIAYFGFQEMSAAQGG